MEDKKIYPRNISFSAQELMKMTGKSESTCQKIIKDIQKEKGLKHIRLITTIHVSEYCKVKLAQIEKSQKN